MQVTATRRRRPLVAGPGFLLAVCLILPTLRVCNSPASPIEFPPAYAVHAGALVLALITLVGSARVMRGLFTTWLGLWMVTAIGIASVVLSDDELGFGVKIAGLFAVPAIAGLVLLHRRGWSERAIWAGGILHGAASVIWYALLASDPNSMYGAYVGFVASALLLGTAIHAYVRAPRTEAPVRLPRAVALIDV